MRRRDFITVTGSVLVAPLAARAQPSALPIVGVLSGTDREDSQIGAIQKGLGELGFVEGRNVALEYRWAEGRFERLPELAADLVSRRVAVILAMQSPNAPRAAQAATSTMPIVFSIGGDPVRLGLVSSLSQPGRNITGATFLVNALGAKRVELLRELVPHATAIGLLINPRNPLAEFEIRDVQAAAQPSGWQVQIEQASREAEIEAAITRFAARRVSALAVAADAVFNSRRVQLTGLAAHHKLPAIYFIRDIAEVGGLMSYGGSPNDAYRLAGAYAGRILKGEKPADLPVQQSTKVELVINLKTARAIGLVIPPALLARADEVIE